MLVPDPETIEGERVKVFDFGIAKLRTDSLSPGRGPSVTQTGTIMGTPTHMAPEQCRGESDITGKADVYALGIILYQSLVGHPPFMAPSTGELLSMHLRDRPAPLRRIDPTIPDMVAELVERMLYKDPGDRPEMSEVVIELEALGAHPTRATATPAGVPVYVNPLAQPGKNPSEKVRVRQPGTLQQATGQTFTTRASKQFRIAIAVAVLLVAVSGVLLIQPWEARESGEVVWSIDSDPPGAEVLRFDNNQLLGMTPWRSNQQRGTGALMARIRKKGYLDQIANFSYADAVTTTVHLEHMPVPDMAQPVDLAQPPMLSWSIKSSPSKAWIINKETQEVLGKTPLELQRRASTGVLVLILRRAGCEDQEITIDKSRDFSLVPFLTCKRAAKQDVPMFGIDEESQVKPPR